MKNSLSIRSYNSQFDSHSHDYHQMVLTLNSYIEIEVEEYKGKVSTGEAILIKAGEIHTFRANEGARFLVADMNSLALNLDGTSQRKFPISSSLLSFIQFVEKQVEHTTTNIIESQLYELFFELIKLEPMVGRIDRRIEKSIALIHKDLSINHSNEVLAREACLGQTQFKKVFKECTGFTVSQYHIKIKMDKARSLLMHTDYSITHIALELGYNTTSAFTKRFSQFFSHPPSQYRKTL